MTTQLKIQVENYKIVVRKESRITTNKLQTFEEKGLIWSVLENGVVKVFSTIVYSEKTYTAMQVAENGICWIANLEKTPKMRFAKYNELKNKYFEFATV